MSGRIMQSGSRDTRSIPIDNAPHQLKRDRDLSLHLKLASIYISMILEGP
jgi:hypothetical protein